jgi:hypothetical protein
MKRIGHHSTVETAIYFNDDVYPGWIAAAPMKAISAADPKPGAKRIPNNTTRKCT